MSIIRIEDTGIALAKHLPWLLADKKGMERYGFALPMDSGSKSADRVGGSMDRWERIQKRKDRELPTEFLLSLNHSVTGNSNLHIGCTETMNIIRSRDL